MKFSDRLWAMAKNDEAVCIKTPEKNTFLVPQGKYAGIWTYNKRKKILKYDLMGSFDIRTEHPSLMMKSEVRKKKAYLALPVNVYLKPNKHYKENGESLDLRWAVGKSKKIGMASSARLLSQLILAYKQTKVWREQKEKFADRVNISLFDESPEMIRALQGLRILFWFSQELVYKAFKEDKYFYILESIGFYSHAIRNMGVTKRWAFLQNCFKLGWKKAWKKAFTKTSEAVLNELATNRSILCVALFENNCKFLKKCTEDYPAVVYEQYYAACKEHERARARQQELAWVRPQQFTILDMRKENFFREAGKLINVDGQGFFAQYEAKGWVALANYAREMIVPNPWGWEMTDWVTAEQARARHEQLVQYKRELLKSRREQNAHETERLHSENWKDLEYPSSWKPLITKLDFDTEHENMHHCIDNYFTVTRSLYAHIEYKDEKATLEWDIQQERINQLYSVSNSTVSQEFQEHVLGTMRDMIAACELLAQLK